MDTHPDPYRLLGVTPAASRREIRRRYRQLLRAHHPDIASDPAAAHEYAAALGAAYRAAMRQAPGGETEPVDFSSLDGDLLQAVRRADPGSGGLHELLRQGEEFAAAGRYAEAQVLCAEALVVDPDRSETHRLLAQVYEGLGLRDEARRERAEAEVLERMGPAPFRPAASAARPREAPATPHRADGAGSARRSPWLLVGAVGAGGCLAASLGIRGSTSLWVGVPVAAIAWGAAAAFCLLLGLAAAGRINALPMEVEPTCSPRAAWPVAVALAAVLWPVPAVAHLAVRVVSLQPLSTWLAVWSAVAGTLVLVGLPQGAAPVFWWTGGNAVAAGALLGWLVGGLLQRGAGDSAGRGSHDRGRPGG